MSNSRTFSSFAALGEALGIEQQTAESTTKKRKCFKCGAEMQNVPGTNAYRCVGTIKSGKPCPNYTLAKGG